jgi:1-deoxy-D-xylulose-5-phosphate synthase
MYDLENDDLLKIIKNSSYDELNVLCDEIRKFLIEKISKTGGHLASNLGIVELTVAMHRVYNSPKDKLIFDVGHQSYVHKIITGRADKFDTLRKYNGLSGFPKSRESVHDAYDTGHSSTSLGAAAGIAKARDLKGEHFNVVALIGDGSMTGGLVYEALNNIGSDRTNMKIILNDNGMSISRNVGALSKQLQKLRSSENYIKTKKQVKQGLDRVPIIGSVVSENISRTKEKIKYTVLDNEGVIIEELGIKYIGPVDGYNIEAMCNAFHAANQINGPALVHVITKKGKGYPFSERNPGKYHGVGPFEIDNGNILSKTSLTYSKAFGEKLLELAEEDKSIVAITAAMGAATGLGPFAKRYRERYFDVGIAEQHAVLFAAGLAKGGMTPVVAVYSSFLQRAFDQIIEDVCLQDLHVIFAVDRAGLVGADGETHHGMFDIAYFGAVPGVTVLAPADGQQLGEMLEYAVKEISGPVAVRYPRGSCRGSHLRLKKFTGKNLTISEGSDVVILAVGAMLDVALDAVALLRGAGYDAGVKNIGVVKPFDSDLADIDTRLVITVEDGVRSGGFGEMYAAECARKGASHGVMTFAIPDQFIEQGTVEQLRELCGLTAVDIVKGAREYLEGKA